MAKRRKRRSSTPVVEPSFTRAEIPSPAERHAPRTYRPSPSLEALVTLGPGECLRFDVRGADRRALVASLRDKLKRRYPGRRLATALDLEGQLCCWVRVVEGAESLSVEVSS
jgi:hypothetical protein